MTEIVDLKDARKAKGRKRGVPTTLDGSKTLDELVDELNKTYALVVAGSDAVILHETTDVEGKPETRFMAINTFRTWFSKIRITDPETSKGAGLGDLWLRHIARRDFRGIEFAPEGAPDGWYNMWRGFSVAPAPLYHELDDHWKRHFPVFHDHILTNLAGGDPSLARWIWGWFAHMFQRPTERIGTSLVLRGKEGVGKSKPFDVIGSLLGRARVKISSPKHLTGSFNAHMRGCIFLQAEEAFWAGDQSSAGTLKDLITSESHLIEPKNVDAFEVRNLIRLGITSNNDWVVPAAFEGRRFAVIEVGEGCIQDKDYFAAIDKEMAEGGLAHLLTWLLNLPLPNDLREVPKTDALREQKLASLDLFRLWWLDVLQDGRLDARHHDWREEVGVEVLYNAYLRHSEKVSRSGRRLAKHQFGKELAKLMPDGFKHGQKVTEREVGDEGFTETVRVNGYHIPPLASCRVNGYHIPPLASCRDKFCELLGHSIAWESEGSAVPNTS